MYNFWKTLRGQSHLADPPDPPSIVDRYRCSFYKPNEDNSVDMDNSFYRNFYEIMMQPKLCGFIKSAACEPTKQKIKKNKKPTMPKICSPRMPTPIARDSLTADERRYKNMLTQMKCFIEMQLECLDGLSKQSYPPNKNKDQTEEPQKQNHIEQTIMNLVQRIDALEKQNNTEEPKKEADKLTEDNVELLNKRACQQEPKTCREPSSKCSQDLKMEQQNIDVPAQKMEKKIEYTHCPNYKPSNQRLAKKLALAAKMYNETYRPKAACQEHFNEKSVVVDATPICNSSVRCGPNTVYIQSTLSKNTQSASNLRGTIKF